MKRIIVLFLLVVVCFSVIPSSQAQVEDQEVVIRTTQGDSAIVPVVESDMICYRTWEVMLFSTQEANSFKIYKDGKVILEGEFDEAGVYSEKVIVDMGMSSKVRVVLNGRETTYNNLKIMRQSITKQDVRETQEAEEITMKMRNFIIQNTKAVLLGSITSLIAFLVAYRFVQKRKNNEIVEGISSV